MSETLSNIISVYDEKIKAIADKLKNMKISKIISIDDEWFKLEKNYINYNDLTEEMYVSFINDLEHEVDFTDDEIDDIGMNYPTRKEFINSIVSGKYDGKLVSYIKDNLSASNEVIQLNNLNSIFIDLKKHYSNIEIHYFNNIEMMNEKLGDDFDDCLYILDILEEGGSSSSKNMIKDNLIEIILSKELTNKLIIFHSHSSKDIESISNYDNRKRFIDSNFNDYNKSVQLSLMYNLCSTSKNENIENLIDELHIKIYEASYGLGVLDYLFYHKKSMIEASDKLVEINFLDTDHFFKTSYFEGDCIIEQYSREISSTYKEYLNRKLEPLVQSEALRRMRDYEYLKLMEVENDLKVKLNVDDKAYKKSMEDTKKKNLKNSLKSRAFLQIANYDVNSTYADPSIGDIYVFNFENETNVDLKFGILVSQECDNVIRNTSRDGISDIPGRVNDYFEVLLFTGKPIKDSNRNSISDYDNKIFPIMFRGEKYTIASTYELIRVPSFVLDICSFNKNGEALLSEELDESMLNCKKYHSKKYYQRKHLDEVNLYFSNIRRVLKDIDDEYTKELMFSLLIEKELGISYADKKFNLARVCRLNRDLSYFILQGYVNKMFRISREPINNEDIAM